MTEILFPDAIYKNHANAICTYSGLAAVGEEKRCARDYESAKNTFNMFQVVFYTTKIYLFTFNMFTLIYSILFFKEHCGIFLFLSF